MGLISLPIMLRYGYDRRIAAGTIAASGTLAQIIPPSLVLIVLADQLGRSVGDMYRGALIPGLVLTGLYMSYILVMSILRPKSMPALPLEARTLGHGVTSLIIALAAVFVIGYGAHVLLSPSQGANADILGAVVGIAAIYAVAILDKSMGLGLLSRLAQQVIIVLIPPLALVFLVLGTIFLGIATPTEGGAMGAVGALVMAAAKGRLTLDVIRQALAATTRLSAFVMFILIGARVFSLTFYGVNGHLWVEHLLTSLPGGELGFLIAVNILVFLLAFFLDFWRRWPRSSASTSSGSACCSASTCRRASCTRPSDSRCSTCARWQRACPISTASPASRSPPSRPGRSTGAPCPMSASRS
jgi:TRAP-type mannitol/chloroaromatic compound transport system permease large subunit